MGVNSKLMLQFKRNSAIEGDRPKEKFSKYSSSYLDFGFTFILQNGEEKLLFAARYWPVRACYLISLNVI